MGKSNQYVFPWYSKHIKKSLHKNVCILGGSKHDQFTQSINAEKFDFFDITLNNWNINDEIWAIELNTYDLVVCTRCAYFAQEPAEFVKKCIKLVKLGCDVIIDWGLGDHWRNPQFIVGWVNNELNVEEAANFQVNGITHTSKLYSTFYDINLNYDVAVKTFLQNVSYKCPRYTGLSLTDIIKNEVPSLLSINDSVVERHLVSIDTLTLWPESPQLYILTKFMR